MPGQPMSASIKVVALPAIGSRRSSPAPELQSGAGSAHRAIAQATWALSCVLSRPSVDELRRRKSDTASLKPWSSPRLACTSSWPAACLVSIARQPNCECRAAPTEPPSASDATPANRVPLRFPTTRTPAGCCPSPPWTRDHAPSTSSHPGADTHSALIAARHAGSSSGSALDGQTPTTAYTRSGRDNRATSSSPLGKTRKVSGVPFSPQPRPGSGRASGTTAESSRARALAGTAPAVSVSSKMGVFSTMLCGRGCPSSRSAYAVLG
mmetsp:Transcript_701/g.2541  ORF Transcript_701/g.2541 Transcript_701/m.2541 type:complete len:267 (+) Transcript_701:931-1731(+)